MKFDHPKLRIFGVINVYAPMGPNGTTKRMLLWRELFDTFSNLTSWILTNDFNMVESVIDHQGGSPHAIAEAKKRSWDHLKQKFYLDETFVRHPGQLHFLWSNRRLVATNPTVVLVLQRIDWCYALISSLTIPFTVISRIVSRYNSQLCNHQL